MTGEKSSGTIGVEYRKLLERKHCEEGDWGTSSHVWADAVRQLSDRRETRDILDYGCGKRSLEHALGFSIKNYDPGIPELADPPVPAEIVVCTDVLEHVEPEHIDAVLLDLERVTRSVGFFTISTRPAYHLLPDGRNAHLIVESAAWWKERLEAHFRIFSQHDVAPDTVLFILAAKASR